MKLLVVGSLAIDTVETPFGKAENSLGGAATYISLTASYFNKNVQVVGVVGDDFPKYGYDLFKKRKINTKGIEIVKGGKTFRWGGKYHKNMNDRDSLFTELNVFENFSPKIPKEFVKTEFVCVGNIEPSLQMDVINQIKKPKFIVGDTMNFWITGKKENLIKTIKKLDLFFINDSEAKLIAENDNLITCGKKILTMGPKYVVIKKGEHGAMLFSKNKIFTVGALPLENIVDPTGAGDCFAGGFIGHISKTGDISFKNLKRAVLYGSVMASFCVEEFSIDGVKKLTFKKIQARYKTLKEISRVD